MKEKNVKAKAPNKKVHRTDYKDFYCTARWCNSGYCTLLSGSGQQL